MRVTLASYGSTGDILPLIALAVRLRAAGHQVVTVGGIIGTVADIRDDEVVLVTDETSRTRIRVTRASIQQVLNGGGSGTAAGAIGAR